MKEVTKLNQCISTKDVIGWFNNLEGKENLSFVIFDIVSFYPAITLGLFNRALDWISSLVPISREQREIYIKSCQSFLYLGGVPWVKKGSVNFDVGMGAYQGAQVCEIVGLCVLHELSVIDGFDYLLYRDDGLGVTGKSPQLQEQMSQRIRSIFAEEGLIITIT